MLYKKIYGYLSIFVLCLSIFTSIFVFYYSNKSTVSANYYNTDQVVMKVNLQRVKYGLRPLVLNAKLSNAASSKADDMIKGKYFSHVSPVNKKWSEFIKDSGYIYIEAGENLATGYDDVDSLIGAWMASPTHRENILSDGFCDTGVAYTITKFDTKTITTVVQVFGRQGSCYGKNLDMYNINNM